MKLKKSWETLLSTIFPPTKVVHRATNHTTKTRPEISISVGAIMSCSRETTAVTSAQEELLLEL